LPRSPLLLFAIKADKVGVAAQLLAFVASDLNRLLHTRQEDLDICILAKKLTSLQQVVKKHWQHSHSGDTEVVDAGKQVNKSTLRAISLQPLDRMVQVYQKVSINHTHQSTPGRMTLWMMTLKAGQL